MMAPDPQPPSQFDAFACSYDSALAQGLAATGEDREFFARGRIGWLKRCLAEIKFRPQTVMEFGCGTGANLPLLRELAGAGPVLGLEISAGSIEVAKTRIPESVAELVQPTNYKPAAGVDLAFCNGVFHHIAPAGRASAIEYVRECLRPGGLFALWENNPWNPGTRWVMRRIPFDRDAEMVTAADARILLEAAGFRILRTDYLFIFPHALRALRPLEARLSGLPLGGQYQVLAVKR